MTIPLEAPTITSFSGMYDWLSNFYPVDGLMTAEHLFQSAKTTDTAWRRTILGAATPREAKRAGRCCPLRPDWEMIKEQAMLEALTWKFAVYSPLAKMLCRTGDAYLEEGNTWGDMYWGTVNGAGQNRLGMLLMQRRAWLQMIMYGKEQPL
jgi:hypothetical protein